MEEELKKQNTNDVSENSDFSEKDKQDINEVLAQGEGFSVEGKDVWLPPKENTAIDQFPENKDEVAFHLAIILGDEESLPWYEKLARERRRDFLKNCLRITLNMFQKGNINKTKAAYFSGVVKGKTAQQQRLEEYKKRHTSLYGYGNKSYGK